jgi:hypothetical protein
MHDVRVAPSAYWQVSKYGYSQVSGSVQSGPHVWPAVQSLSLWHRSPTTHVEPHALPQSTSVS